MYEVVSMRGQTSKKDTPGSFYVGRPSPLGNPYRAGVHGTRDEVIAKYRHWLWQRMQIPDSLQAKEINKLALQQDGKLVCWCAPLKCHGDVIAKAIEWWRANKLQKDK